MAEMISKELKEIQELILQEVLHTTASIKRKEYLLRQLEKVRNGFTEIPPKKDDEEE